MVVSTWIIALALFWYFTHDSTSAWWFWLIAITSTLLISLHRMEGLIPLSYRAHRIAMRVLSVILWTLLVIMVLSIAGILPAIFH